MKILKCAHAFNVLLFLYPKFNVFNKKIYIIIISLSLFYAEDYLL